MNDDKNELDDDIKSTYEAPCDDPPVVAGASCTSLGKVQKIEQSG
jgi:hypothetical protein